MYVAQKKMKVQVRREDGSVGVDERQVGDPVPEAAHWPDIGRWLNQGFVIHAPADHPAAKMTVPDPQFKATVRKNGKASAPHTEAKKAVAESKPKADKPKDSTPEAALEALDKKQIKEFAKAEYDLELDGRMSKADMISAVVEASEG